MLDKMSYAVIFPYLIAGSDIKPETKGKGFKMGYVFRNNSGPVGQNCFFIAIQKILYYFYLIDKYSQMGIPNQGVKERKGSVKGTPFGKFMLFQQTGF